MISYELTKTDDKGIKFWTDNEEFLNLAYEYLKVLADAMSYRNSVVRIAKEIENRK